MLKQIYTLLLLKANKCRVKNLGNNLMQVFKYQ